MEKTKCPECNKWSPTSKWRETDVGCEDCGSHPAKECPLCYQPTDLIYNELETREDDIHATINANASNAIFVVVSKNRRWDEFRGWVKDAVQYHYIQPDRYDMCIRNLNRQGFFEESGINF